MAESAQPRTGTKPDATAVYALDSSDSESARLHRQADELARLARPGSWVAGLEPDVEQAGCYPPHPAYTRICEIFPVVFGRNGADLTIGRRVPELFRQAGLEMARVEAKVQMYPRVTPGGRSGSTWCVARAHRFAASAT